MMQSAAWNRAREEVCASLKAFCNIAPHTLPFLSLKGFISKIKRGESQKYKRWGGVRGAVVPCTALKSIGDLLDRHKRGHMLMMDKHRQSALYQ